MPTPPFLRSNVVSPPWNLPDWAFLIAVSTATSTFFSAEVRMWLPR
jgi:hypothetical protein